MIINKVYYAGCFIEREPKKYAFQKRDIKTGISSPGTISTFGGRIKEDETALSAIKRELKEELNIETEANEYKYVGYFERYDEYMGHFVGCTYFYLNFTRPINFCNEGKLIELHEDNIMDNSSVGNVTKEMFFKIINYDLHIK